MVRDSDSLIIIYADDDVHWLSVYADDTVVYHQHTLQYHQHTLIMMILCKSIVFFCDCGLIENSYLQAQSKLIQLFSQFYFYHFTV